MQLDNLFRATEGARFTNGNAAQVGVQGGVSLDPVIGLIGNVTYTKTAARFTLAGVDSAAPVFRASPDLGIWLFDADLQIRIPLGYVMTPFVQVGIGGAHYSVRMNGSRHGDTQVAYAVGVGADVPLSHNVGLVVLARNYIVALEWDDVGDPRLDDHLEKNTTSNIGVSLGLEIGY
jgi:opacity protein-like surface antigen